MRGGISTDMQRYAKANNPYLHGYDPDKETSYILFLDANNLYGWAMSQPLPNHVMASKGSTPKNSTTSTTCILLPRRQRKCRKSGTHLTKKN